tara:strand:- start:67596 stop:68426 length:831 start_codon:yes stop_codon:yes gene_type:complete
MNLLIEHEQTIRVSVFIGLLVVLSGAEFLAPMATRRSSRPFQWFTNLSMVLLDNMTLKYLFPLLAAGAAKLSAESGFGLFNTLDLNFWIEFGLSLLLLDLLIYGQHVLMHKIPMLWRLHRMHHTELGLDVTSAVRFHPIEIIISMLIKIAFVVLLGISVEAVIVFEILLNGLALFNHSNIKIAGPLEKILRKVIITPEIHWIHHSEIAHETNSNYGFNLVFWDKLFGTYIDKPTLNYDVMRQGLREFGFNRPMNLLELLISPFKSYPVKSSTDKES